MTWIMRGAMAVALFAVLLTSACAKRVPALVYVIHPLAGQEEITDEEKDTLRTALDAVAAKYGMEKSKPGQANVVRYYPPTAQLQVGFYAVSDNKRVVVYASPLAPYMDNDATYLEFRQALEAKLRGAFGSQVMLEQPPEP